MGVFEIPQFSNGTNTITTILAGLEAITVIGGGATAETIAQIGLTHQMTHVFTGGGGASISFFQERAFQG
jgi:phosphoglycerate kinase